MSSAPNYSPGVMKYVEAAQKLLAERDAALARMKTMRFDTVAVHGLYTVEEALNRNQGAVIEPLYLSTSQAYADSDELEAALAYLVPTWCYTRIANPTTYYLEWVLALLEGYRTGCDTSCCVTASGMSAIMSAVDPFLVKQKDGPERINFVSCIQVYGGTFQHFSLRKMKERGIECRWVRTPGTSRTGSRISTRTPASSTWKCPRTRSSRSRTSRRWPTWPTPGASRSSSTPPARRRP